MKMLAQICLVLVAALAAHAQELPHMAQQDGRHALMVDNKPFLILGAQINNSSSWASTLPEVWPALDALHVNTVEAPVYWEQMEPEQGKFDFTNVDLLIDGAREHHLHLVLLWFGTWKNGQNHYVPEWIKANPAKYPREVSAYGKLLDVMSPNSETNLSADKSAFSALMRHVKQVDGTQHTVLMIQVENESGSIGAVRDYSAAANKEFAGNVPETLAHRAGTWSMVYGAAADERFAAYSTARYINEVAKAGKAEYPLPMYCNVWITYPVHALETRNHPSPGQEYPSGGPQQGNIAIWKATAPSIDILAPDFYSDDRALFRQVIATYHRDDNALFIPETGLAKEFGSYFFYALGHGAIGFSPFGVDYTHWTLTDDKIPDHMAENFALLAPIAGVIAQLNYGGKLQTAVEQKGEPRQSLHFPD
jgi:beta-galactosidase GanA